MDVLALAPETTNQLIAVGAALVGAIIGGLSTGAATLYFERRRERGDVRQGTRLLTEELSTLSAAFKWLVEDGQYPEADYVILPTEQWEEHRGALARHLNDHTWDSLSGMMDAIPYIRRELKKGPAQAPLTESHMSLVREKSKQAADCYRLLARKDPP